MKSSTEGARSKRERETKEEKGNRLEREIIARLSCARWRSKVRAQYTLKGDLSYAAVCCQVKSADQENPLKLTSFFLSPSSRKRSALFGSRARGGETTCGTQSRSAFRGIAIAHSVPRHANNRIRADDDAGDNVGRIDHISRGVYFARTFFFFFLLQGLFVD